MTRNETIQAIIGNFDQFKRLLHSHYYDTFTKLGLSPAQLELLMLIRRHEPISHKALASKLQLTPSAVSQLLEGLDKASCISRSQSPSDRRISYVSISRAGKRKLEELQKLRERLFTNAFDTLSEADLLAYSKAQQNLIAWFETNKPNKLKKEKQ